MLGSAPSPSGSYAFPSVQRESLSHVLWTSFGNGLAPGRLGFSGVAAKYGVQTAPFALGAAIPGDPGKASVTVNASVSGLLPVYLTKGVYHTQLNGAFYFSNAVGVTSNPAILVLETATGVVVPQVKLNSSGKIVLNLSGSTQTSSAVIQLGNAAVSYLLAWSIDVSTSTFQAAVTVQDTSGNVLATLSTSLAGQVPDMVTEIREGFASQTGTLTFGSSCADAGLAQYPRGPFTADDTDTGKGTGLPGFSQTMIDDPNLIAGGTLVGATGQMYWSLPCEYGIQLQETAAKFNRSIWMSHLTYQTDIYAPLNLSVAQRLQDGRLLGHYCLPVFEIFGFQTFTKNWPDPVPVPVQTFGVSSSCLAAWFTDGQGNVVSSGATMDSQLAGWASLFKQWLSSPYLVYLFREMNGGSTIYGASGASNQGVDAAGAACGVNETPQTFVAAFQYISRYLCAADPNCRVAFAIGTGGSSSYPQSEWGPYLPDLSTFHVAGCDGFVKAPNDDSLATHFSAYWAAFNPFSGTISRDKPLMIGGTGVDASLADRISDVHQVATDLQANIPGYAFCNFQDSANTGSPPVYAIEDVPTGYLAAFQSVVSAAPFLGVPLTRSSGGLLGSPSE